VLHLGGRCDPSVCAVGDSREHGKTTQNRLSEHDLSGVERFRQPLWGIAADATQSGERQKCIARKLVKSDSQHVRHPQASKVTPWLQRHQLFTFRFTPTSCSGSMQSMVCSPSSPCSAQTRRLHIDRRTVGCHQPLHPPKQTTSPGRSSGPNPPSSLSLPCSTGGKRKTRSPSSAWVAKLDANVSNFVCAATCLVGLRRSLVSSGPRGSCRTDGGDTV
jgi:hypothetical protein